MEILNKYGICTLTTVPLRKEKSHQSEVVTELLFGECFTVIEAATGWLYVQCYHDTYKGWLDERQATFVEENDWKRYCKTNTFCANLVGFVQYKDEPRQAIPLGCPLVELPDYLYFGDAYYFKPLSDFARLDTLRETALAMLGAPYRWGGRSPFGIDCSGFVQLMFRMIGIKIPRDAAQQAEEGKLVAIDEAQMGDLAFFKDGSNKLSHVGIVWENGKILHAAGRVRLDDLHRKGIFDGVTYTHTLAWVRRFI